MDTGAAGRVMPAEMFPRVKDVGEETTPFKAFEGMHRCRKIRSASVVEPLISM